MKIFKLINNNITLLTDEISLIREFSNLLNRDKSKDKHIAFNEFKYIYFVSDYASPYIKNGLDGKHLHNKALENVDIDINNNDELLLNAISKYKELQDSLELRIYQNLIKTFNVTDKVIDKIRKDIEAKLEEESNETNVTSLVNLLRTLLTLSQDIPDKLESLKKCEDLIKKQQEAINLGRGNTKITNSMDESQA